MQKELEMAQKDIDNILQGRDLIISTMVKESIDLAWVYGQEQMAATNVEEATLVSQKYKVVNAALHLAGKGKPHPPLRP